MLRTASAKAYMADALTTAITADLLSLIGVKEPGMIGVMEPV